MLARPAAQCIGGDTIVPNSQDCKLTRRSAILQVEGHVR
jgi:hypothetical protein